MNNLGAGENGMSCKYFHKVARETIMIKFAQGFAGGREGDLEHNPIFCLLSSTSELEENGKGQRRNGF